jgi:hypothetical protein
MGLSGGAEVPAPDINNFTTKNVGDGMHAEGGRWGIQAVGEAAGIHAVPGKRGRGGEFSAGIANIRLKPGDQNLSFLVRFSWRHAFA